MRTRGHRPPRETDGMTTPDRRVQVRRADDRFTTRQDGVETLHCFSFGRHYDPAHVSHGPLVVCDEHRLEPTAGFPDHPHRDVEVVTWVLEGVLAHEGPGGRRSTPVGTVQRMSAGGGVVHAERAGGVATRFVQAWLVADPAQPASYEQRVVDPARLQGRLAPVASGLGHPDALRLGPPAALHVARLAPGEAVRLPAAPLVHLLVGSGRVEVDGEGLLTAGDSFLGTASGALELRAADAAEVLVWEMQVTPLTPPRRVNGAAAGN